MSQHHRAWNGSKVTRARKIIQAQLPLPCVECGRPVMPDDTFDIGHIVPLSQGGNLNDYGASHRSCNRSAGGRMGANKTNLKRKRAREW